MLEEELGEREEQVVRVRSPMGGHRVYPALRQRDADPFQGDGPQEDSLPVQWPRCPPHPQLQSDWGPLACSAFDRGWQFSIQPEAIDDGAEYPFGNRMGHEWV